MSEKRWACLVMTVGRDVIAFISRRGYCLIARVIAETGGTSGLRDEALLESALAAARNRHRYEAADVVSCAAAYSYHLMQRRAFLDGNSPKLMDLN